MSNHNLSLFSKLTLLTVFISFFELYGQITFLPLWLTPFRAILVVSLITFIIYIYKGKIDLTSINSLDWSIILFLIANIVSIKNAQNYQNFSYKILHISGFSLLYFLISFQDFNRAFKNKLYQLFLLLSILLVSFGAIDCINIFNQIVKNGVVINHISGFYETHGRYSAMLAFLYIFLSVMYFKKEWIRYPIYVLFAVLIGFTYIRGVYLGLFLSLLISILYILKKENKIILKNSFIIYSIVISVFILSPIINKPFIKKITTNYYNSKGEIVLKGNVKEEYEIGKESSFGLGENKEKKYNSEIQKPYRGGSNLNRLYLYSSAFLMFYDYPIFGVGTGNFGFHLKYYADKRFYDYAKHRGNEKILKMYPHNSIIRILAENGIAGLLVFLFLALSTLRMFKNLDLCYDNKWILFLFISLLFIFIISLVDDFINRNIFWISLGLLSSMHRTKNKSVP